MDNFAGPLHFRANLARWLVLTVIVVAIAAQQFYNAIIHPVNEAMFMGNFPCPTLVNARIGMGISSAGKWRYQNFINQ
jgi:hypothetical protein